MMMALVDLRTIYAFSKFTYLPYGNFTHYGKVRYLLYSDFPGNFQFMVVTNLYTGFGNSNIKSSQSLLVFPYPLHFLPIALAGVLRLKLYVTVKWCISLPRP